MTKKLTIISGVTGVLFLALALAGGPIDKRTAQVKKPQKQNIVNRDRQ